MSDRTCALDFGVRLTGSLDRCWQEDPWHYSACETSAWPSVVLGCSIRSAFRLSGASALPARTERGRKKHAPPRDRRGNPGGRRGGHPPARASYRATPQEVPAPQENTVADEVAGGLDDPGHGVDYRVETIISRMGLDPEARFEAPLLGNEAAGCSWPRPWWPTRTSSCSTSRRTTSTLSRSAGWRISSPPLRRHLDLRHPRPRIPRAAGDPDRRARPRRLASTGPATTRRSSSGEEEVLNAEARQNALFDKRLAQEEVWIRKGSRRGGPGTRAVRALKAMRECPPAPAGIARARRRCRSRRPSGRAAS